MQPSQQATAEQLKKRIEDKAQDTGFTFSRANAAAAEASPESKSFYIQEHLEVDCHCNAMMFVSFLINQASRPALVW